MGIKTKLLIIISSVVLASYVILGFNNIKNMYDTSYEALKLESIKSSNESARYINDFLVSKIMIVESVANELSTLNQNTNKEFVRDMLIVGKNSGGFASVYAGYSNNGLMLRWSGRDTIASNDSYDPRSRPWYKSAYTHKSSGVTKPYIDSATKKLTITIFAPIIKDSQVVGVVGSDIFLDTIVDTVLNIDTNNLGLAYLVDNLGETLIHEDIEKTNKTNIAFSKIKNLKDGFADIQVDNNERLIAFSKINIVDWYLFIDIDKKKAFRSVDKQLFIFAVLSLFFLLSTIAVVYFTLNKILTPIQDVQSGIINFFEYLKGNTNEAKKLDVKTQDEFGVMAKEINKGIEAVHNTLIEDKKVIAEVTSLVNEVKSGILSKRVTSTTSNHAVQELVIVLNDMIENLQNTIAHSLEILTQYQSDNYTHKTDISCSGEIKELMDGINKLGETISNMLVENKQNGLELDESSDTLVKNVNELSQNSNHAATAIEEIAAALDEVTSTIVTNNENVVQMAQYANSLTSSANSGQSLAKETSVSMTSIDEQVSSINDAITVIDQIAFQTNILSLNAAVEAATAGEAGKGFAVVAAEVRNLAGRSAQAAKEIKDLVESATSKANDGKMISDKMIEGYNELNENISKTSELIKSVEQASKEQQTGIVQINESINSLDKQTQQNAIIASQTNNIAIKTDEISKVILSKVNQKEFIGKDSVKIKKEPEISLVEESKNKPKENKPVVNQEIKKQKPKVIVEDDTEDEWESF